MQEAFGYNTVRTPRGATAVVAAVVAMLSSAARVEAFQASGRATASGRSLSSGGRVRQAASRGRARLSTSAAEPVSESGEGTHKFKDVDASNRTFFERIGSPKYIAAPMVEHSEAAFRYLVRRHGTQLAYTQMIHSAKFSEDNGAKFRESRFDGTDEAEDRPLVVQFCGNDPDTVVRAARYIEDRVDAVDLNLGCPQKIARKGNYGAFLLPKAELCERIIATMSRELSVPVTVKIRALENDADTLDLVRRLEGAGAQLLTVHGRTVRQAKTTQGVANWDIIRKVKESVSIPVVANGGVETLADAERLLTFTGADAVMSSEGLLENPSLFDPEITPLDELEGLEVAHRLLSLSAEYMELAWRFSAPMISVKGHLFKMMYRLLMCQTDLRDRLAHWQADKEVAQAVVNEMCQRYGFDPRTRTALEGFENGGEMPIALPSWYNRHRPDKPKEIRNCRSIQQEAGRLAVG